MAIFVRRTPKTKEVIRRLQGRPTSPRRWGSGVGSHTTWYPVRRPPLDPFRTFGPAHEIANSWQRRKKACEIGCSHNLDPATISRLTPKESKIPNNAFVFAVQFTHLGSQTLRETTNASSFESGVSA